MMIKIIVLNSFSYWKTSMVY